MWVPRPGATRELGASYMLHSLYARQGALSTPMSRAYSPECGRGISEVGLAFYGVLGR